MAWSDRAREVRAQFDRRSAELGAAARRGEEVSLRRFPWAVPADLRRLADAAVAAVVRSLCAADEDDVLALMKRVEVSGSSRLVCAALDVLAHHPSPHVRAMACQMVSIGGGTAFRVRAFGRLREWVRSDPDPYVRLLALQPLAGFERTRVRRSAFALLSDIVLDGTEDPRLRTRAIELLLAYRDRDSAPGVRRVVVALGERRTDGSEDERVRAKAVEVLGRRSSTDPLLELLGGQ